MKITGDMFFYISLIILLYYRYKSVKNKNRKVNIIRELMIILFGIYLIKLMSLVFLPVIIKFGDNVIRKNPIVWINPLKSIYHILNTNNLFGVIYNIGGNIILLMPLPIFLIYFFGEKVDNMVNIIVICFLFSLGIEILQYIESLLIPSLRRYFETNDILLNTAGGVFGYIIYDRYLRKIINN